MAKLSKKLISKTLFGFPSEGLVVRAIEETGLKGYFSPAGDDVWHSEVGGEKRDILTSYKLVKYFLDTDFKEVAISYKVDGVTKESIIFDAGVLPEKKALQLDFSNLETGAKKLVSKLPFTISVKKKKK